MAVKGTGAVFIASGCILALLASLAVVTTLKPNREQLVTTTTVLTFPTALTNPCYQCCHSIPNFTGMPIGNVRSIASRRHISLHIVWFPSQFAWGIV